MNGCTNEYAYTYTHLRYVSSNFLYVEVFVVIHCASIYTNYTVIQPLYKLIE
jgi:hypothetical protein